MVARPAPLQRPPTRESGSSPFAAKALWRRIVESPCPLPPPEARSILPGAGIGRGGIFSEAVGLGARPKGPCRAAPLTEKSFSRERSSENRGAANWTEVLALVCARQANAFRVFRWALDRDPPRDDGKVEDGGRRVPPRKTRPLRSATGAPDPRLSRCPSFWPGPVPLWNNRAEVVAGWRTRNCLGSFRSGVSQHFPRSPRTGANQSSCPDAKRICRHRQLDGGRNPLARKDRTVSASRLLVLHPTHAVAPRDAVCRERIVAHHWSRSRRSTA
jgi:hypothetical protein